MSTGQFLLNAGGSRLHLASGDSPAFPYQPLDEMGKAKQETRPWSSYIWDSWDKSPEERNFLRRLDACLITYAALSYFSKYLDQQNVTNAYVSGMQEDLRLHGNQLNYITTSWTVGYVIGQIPSNMLITRIRPSIWIPAMELIWSSLTMCLALSINFSTLCAIRFLVGLAESTFYPAIQYVIGSWYKKEELAKRSCIFHTASAVGPMVSGFLQAGVYNGLNNRGGVAGWKWLFIIDGVITIPIALLGFIIMPDLPTTTKPSIFYTQEQLDIGIKRMESEGRKPPEKFTKAKVLSFFSTWHIYTLVPLYVLFNNGNGGATSMIFWLKSFNKPGHIVYTIGQINTYPLGIYSLQIVTTLIYAWWSDAVVARWPPILVAGVWSIITYSVLAATPVYTHIARRWTFYYFTGCMGGLSGLIMAWVNELNSHDNEKRAFVVASCNMFAYVFQAWLPIVIFPQVQQPRVFVGNITTACINFSMIIAALTTLSFQRRDQRRAAISETRTPGDVTDDGHESIKSIGTKRRAEEGVP
ncbi:MFS general substrate transporter [Lactarius pseudohatsudake]|nr:MFS general substrate transporter [Lactarius pseudohatsudake]